MNTKAVQTWIWILIYLGMIVLGLGLAVHRRDFGLGWLIIAPGLVSIAIGIVLIWVRSRIKNTKETSP